MNLRTMFPDEFPHGLRCFDCEFSIPAGACYVPVEIGENTDILVCAFCAVNH